MNLLHSLATGITGVFGGHHFSAAGVGLLALAVLRASAGDWIGAATTGLSALAAFGLHVSLPSGMADAVKKVIDTPDQQPGGPVSGA